MKEEFEEWAESKVSLVHHGDSYANSDARLSWLAWQRAWNIAVREQRRRDEVEIDALKHRIAVAINALKL